MTTPTTLPHDVTPQLQLVDEPAPAHDLGELFAGALGASPEGVVIHGGGGRILACNAAASVILGLTFSEICGRTSADPDWRAVRPDGTSFPGDEHPASVTLRTGEAVKEAIMGVHRPDGALRWIRITSWPLAIGCERGAVAYFSDVTATRRLEHDLATARGRLALAVEAGGVGLWEWDLRTGRIWCDDGFARIVGRRDDPDEHPVERFWGHIHPEDRTRAAADMDRIAAGGPPSDVSYRVIGDDGAVRILLAQGQVTQRDGGRGLVVAGVVVDVTERTAAADAVLRHLEAMTDGYLAVDLDWRFTYLNSRAEALLGQGRGDLLGRVVWDVFPEAQGTAFERAYRHALESGAPVALTEYYPPLDAWFDVTATPSPSGLSVYFRDATDRRAIEDERERLLAAEQQARADAERSREAMAYAATHDDLTGLANRAALHCFLDATLADAGTAPVAAVFVDVDRFKLINDSGGHAEGDRALQAIAHRLRALVTEDVMLARVGGDEFVIVATGTPDEVELLGEQILHAFQRPITLDRQPHVATVSVGIACSGEQSTTETLLRDADTALYRAKDEGGNRVRLFGDDLRRRVVRRLSVEQRLRIALDSRALGVAYQPIFDLATGKPDGIEALCRWVDAQLGAVSPAEFIPVAEETGLILSLGREMRDRAGVDASALLDSTNADAVVWVNASMFELELPCVADHVIASADALPGLVLGIEVTESALRDDDSAMDVLHRLAGAGIRIAIDDFGTGYSSLARLGKYPVDLLKIDRSFVAAVDDDATRSLVAAIVQLARAVGARTCAEGVESIEQLHALQGLGVDSASGYFLARPSPIRALRAAVQSGSAVLTSAMRQREPRANGDRARPGLHA